LTFLNEEVRYLETPDIDLVNNCLKGNQDSFTELVGRYKKLVYSVVYNMIRDKEEVNDISQEVFLRIYRALGRYNPEYKFSTWSVKIATNYCLDVLRKKKIDSMPIDEAVGVSSDIDTPEEQYIKTERSNKIQQAIAELPEKYRLPLILFHQNGLSYDEMSKILSEPMTIIKNRLYRARLMLKEKLKPYREEEVL